MWHGGVIAVVNSSDDKLEMLSFNFRMVRAKKIGSRVRAKKESYQPPAKTSRNVDLAFLILLLPFQAAVAAYLSSSFTCRDSLSNQEDK